MPLISNPWLSLKSPPIRNWMVQQMIKIAFARSAPEPITIFIDSDVVFIRPFSLANFVQQGKLRLYREPECYLPIFDSLYTSTYRLLGLGDYSHGTPRPVYIGNLISWRRSNVIALCDYLEQISGRPWLETLAWSRTMSEYMLYGEFVDRILGEAAGHFADPDTRCYAYWLPQPMDEEQMSQFFAATPASAFALMISAKAGMSPSHYTRFLRQLNRNPAAVGLAGTGPAGDRQAS
jgi:hypothetical protein